MNWILAIVGILILIVVASASYGKRRVAMNFRMVYIRALRVEQKKDIAIFEALKFISGFLKPFDQLSEEDMHFIADTFHELNDPPAVLQLLLQRAEQLQSVSILKDREALLRWKAQLS